VAETTVKRLLCCEFRRTGKEKETSVSIFVEDMPRNKCFLSRFECRTFYVYL
jgi:hypothetical protein